MLALLLATFLVAQPTKPIAFLVKRLHPVDEAPIDEAALVIQGGKIIAVGKANAVAIPADAEVRKLPDAVIIPGLVDAHSHVGIFPSPKVPGHADGNEMSGPVQPGLRALDAVWPDDPGFRMAVTGGVTTANIMPGSGNVIGGSTLYVKMRGRTIDEMRIQADGVEGGLKMANGENPKGYGRRGQAPFTRMKVAALQRETFAKAVEYKRKWDQFAADRKAGKKTVEPERDPLLEPLVEVLNRRRTVHFHCHRADDILTAVRLSEEFGFEIVLQHATEGYRVADELAAKRIPVSLTLLDSPGGKAETMGLIEENAAILVKAGVPVSINTDDSITESRFFLRTGSIAVRGGLSPEEALKAMTLTPARLLHVDRKVGSLTIGKDADFVILSGSPFSVYTQVLETWIDGKPVFRRQQRRDWLYQAGGFALADPERLPPPPPLVAPLPSLPAIELPKNGEVDGMVQVVYAARIHTSVGEPILDGVIVIEQGRIKAVGKRGTIAVPAQAVVLHAREVTAGLIDAQSVVGLTGAVNIPADQDQDELSDPNQADLRVIDGFHPNEPLLGFLRAQGVTTIHATAGRVNVLAGQTGIFHTAGTTVERMTIRFPAGVLVNLGEVPKEAFREKGPRTRMATAALIRKAFADAQNALAKSDGPRNLKAEGLAPALKREVPVYFAAHRADDLLTALRIAEEFRLRPILALGTEAYLILPELKKHGVPVIVHPPMQRAAGSMETFHSHLGTAGALADHGITAALSTSYEGYVPKSRNLRLEAAVAAVNGLGTARGLRAVTIDAAKLLGIDKDYGSIEVGKAADLVLYDGDPFEQTTHVEYTLIGGRIVYDRSEIQSMPLIRRATLFGTGFGGGCCLDQ